MKTQHDGTSILLLITILKLNNASLLISFIVSTVNGLEFMIDSTSAINFKEGPWFFIRAALVECAD